MTSPAPGTTATVAAITNDFLIHRKDAAEYFILENRQRAGRDSALPDNRFDLERGVNAGDVEDLYGAPVATSFGSGTAPSSRWWNRSDSGLEIVSVSVPGPSMTITTK